MSATGPIADLSYRNYDGPKGLAKARWWPIAKNGLRISIKKKGFWVLAIFSMWQYIFLIFMLFIRGLGAGRMSQFLPSFPGLLGWAFSAGLWPFILALFVGTGCIAADNRANALQVYLAKPITKRDYLIGKWLYIFLLVFAVYFVPLLLCTLYQALSVGFASFLRENPLIFPKLVLISMIPGVVHASILVGISAWNKTTWLVGVIYRGIYLFSATFATVLSFTLRDDVGPKAVETVKLLSIGGAISGTGTTILGAVPQFIGEGREHVLPYFWPLFLIVILVSVLGVFLAAMRICAVEVVQG